MQAVAAGKPTSKKLPKWLDKLAGIEEPGSKRKDRAPGTAGSGEDEPLVSTAYVAVQVRS